MPKKRKQKQREISPEEIKKEIERMERDLNNLHKAKELNEMLLNIRTKNPKVINPNFEFERTKEYEEYLVKKAKFDYDKWHNETYLPNVKYLKEKIDGLKKQLGENNGWTGRTNKTTRGCW